eukprot:scaffold8072_cov71-Skeletonema_marinoi.AAC.1
MHVHSVTAATKMIKIKIVYKEASIFQFVEICPSPHASLLASASQLEDVKSKGRLMKSGAQTSVFTVMAVFIVAACLATADS